MLPKLIKFFRQLIKMGLAIFGLLAIALVLVRFLITGSLTCAPKCVGINLLGRDLQGVTLQKAKLMEAQLQNANLTGANLREVDLSGANLNHVNLRNADLTDARLIGANLSQARLEGSILNGADLSGADLSEADLTNVDMRATLVNGVNFVKAKLTSVQFQGANLSGLDFSEAEMAGINLTNANLAGAALSRANLNGALLVQSDLTGAWLNLTNLVGANLSQADLAGSSLVGAELASANLQNSNLEGVVLVGAQLDGTNLRGTNLKDVDILQARLPARILQLDPILRELNDLQRQPLLRAANLSGVAFDATTIWPPDALLKASATDSNKLALASSTGTMMTTGTTTPTTSIESGQAANKIEGLPTAKRLAINFFVNSIRNVSAETGEFSVDFYLDLYWNEPGIPVEQKIADLDPATFWNPQVSLVNSQNGRYLFEVYDNSHEPDSNIRLSSRAVGDFTAVFDLHKFPFDQQILPITMEPGNGNSDTVLLEFSDLTQRVLPSEQAYVQEIPKGRYVDGQAVNAEWEVRSAQIVQQLYVYMNDQSSRSRFQIELTLARHAAPYIWKYMLPLLLLALLTWGVCLIESQELVKRLWLLLVLLLTLVAFHAIRWGTLPKVAYITYLDSFLLLHYVVLSSVITAVFAIRFLQRQQRLHSARWLNRGLLWGYPVFYVGLNFVLYWRIWW